jgi:hypothetical protein
VQVEPVFAGDRMPDGVAGVRVQHHLGIAYRAGRKIHQAGIIAARLGSCKFGRCLVDDLVIAGPPLSPAEIGIMPIHQDRNAD